VGGKHKAEAQALITNTYTLPSSITITINTSTGSKTALLETKNIEAAYQYEESIQKAYDVGRSGNLLKDIETVSLLVKKPSKFSIPVTYNESLLTHFIDTLPEIIDQEPVYPRFILKNGAITIENGKPGDELPLEYVRSAIMEALVAGHSALTMNTKVVNPVLTESEIQTAIERATVLLPKSIQLTIESKVVQTLKIDKLVTLLKPNGGYDQEKVRLLTDGLTEQYEKEVTEPVFKFEGNRVVEFSPGNPGIKIDKELLFKGLIYSVSLLEKDDEQTSYEIPHSKADPKTEISDVNNLGITELIGKGTSNFKGSIPSRIHNVSLAASRINGVLIPPGKVFSFNESLGDISKYTGYKEAYVIKDGKTVLGDGGGVCQVSTTLFRAVLNAGLPITERRAHAYRVGYYEQGFDPGLDATIYSPTTDFKFTNDTGNYILIQTKVDTKNLTAEFSLYGTSDGRKVTLTKPIVTNQIAPEEDLYVDDPTLPTGRVTQVEHKAWGAKVSFNYSVERDGAVIYQKNFVSTYQPWRAVYMKGTGPAQ